MKRIRLEAAGYFQEDGKDLSESVYERPVMLVYTGSFESMDGPVTIDENHIKLIHDTHNSFLSRLKRMASGEIPMRDCPPLQLDHSPSAQHTVGRLVGPLTTGKIDVDGELRMALFGTARFLGRENVEKAKDGRWTNVSIGADLESGKLNELSVTPFPAAPSASLLSARLSAGEHKGHKYEIQKTADGTFEILVDGKPVKTHAGTEDEVRREAERYIDEEAAKLSAGQGDSMETKDEMKARHLSEKEALKGQHDEELKTHKLEEVKSKHEEALKKLTDKHADELKKLGAEEKPAGDMIEDEKEKEAKMARKTSFIKLTHGFRTQAKEAAGEIRLASVVAKVARLRSAGKITPAEIKKIDFSKFKTMGEEAVKAALESYDSREPIVLFGAMAGTTKAEAISKVQQKYRMARMELESRMNMPSKRRAAEAHLSRLAEEEKKELAEVGQPNEADPTKGMLSGHPSFEQMSKMLDEGKHEELKACLKHMHEKLSHLGEHVSEGDDARMSALAKTHSALQNQFDELVALASPALGVTSDEI